MGYRNTAPLVPGLLGERCVCRLIDGRGSRFGDESLFCKVKEG